MAGHYPIISGVVREDSRWPFGPDFFRRRFAEYIRQYCKLNEDSTQVVEVVLASGAALDICHIEEIADEYLLLAVYLDTRTCEDIYRTYIRYDAIFQINVIDKPVSSRPVGFNAGYKTVAVSETPAAKKTPAKSKSK
ncbi:MAG: hypothetical protein HUU29_13130 [Planctomycetaceae bacterium]|nr:hypothetical protein [Planctomycetaceae bacterium]